MSLEALIERVTLESPAADIAAAKGDFFARTGSVEPSDPFYEERMRAAFDDAVTQWGTPPGLLLRRWLEGADREPLAHALLRAWRSLFAVTKVGEHAELRAVLTHARLRLVRDDGPAGRLREGDLFDGRVLAEGGARLMPGVVFFERDAHALIEPIVRAAERARLGSDALCDSLLRMQMRLFRQSSLRPHHVYRADALDRMEILAAPWARPKR